MAKIEVKTYDGKTVNPITSSDAIKTPDNSKLVTQTFLSNNGKKELFIDLWTQITFGYSYNWETDKIENKQWGGYNEETGYFYLYDIDNITYQEAIDIYNAGTPTTAFTGLVKPIRTNLPQTGRFYGGNIDTKSILKQCNCTEYASYIDFYLDSYFAYYGSKPSKIVVRDYGIDGFACRFGDDGNLEEIRFTGADKSVTPNNNLGLQGCSKLTVKSVNEIIRVIKVATTPRTVTFHPDVYCKIAADESNELYTSLSDEEKEEWAKILPMAEERNLQIATW